MTTDPPYITAPSSASPDQRGEVGGLGRIAILRDSLTGLYARHTYRDAQAAAALVGARLPTPGDIDIIRDAALVAGSVLDPVTLPDPAMVAAAGCRRVAFPAGEEGRVAYLAAYQRTAQGLLNRHMGGEEWAREHDRRVAAQIAALGLGSGDLIFGEGKHYCAGAPEGRAWLKGWFVRAAAGRAGRYIQTGPSHPSDQGPHSDTGSRDYGTTCLVVML